ncbi:hypothetical protein [Streptomyces lonarensis]|uniref:Flp pilus assembly protein RcpC/CpaB domain-containing protein n=1 Tax=Streptomyces lonarensis TaxID=700599 RepID=A0A7X6I0J7_9ACTN|nr:hypothetical protein [Streptomyces lonarensis]NJQ07736.1 hypothetical protein [Streptomyces lonarensis]
MNSADTPHSSRPVPSFPPVVVRGGPGLIRRSLRGGRRLLATALIGTGVVLSLLALAPLGRPAPAAASEAASPSAGPAVPEAPARADPPSSPPQAPTDSGETHGAHDPPVPDLPGQEGEPDDGAAVFAPVRLADPAVGGLLEAGDLVDILAAPATTTAGETPGAARRIAHRARVAEIPPPEETGPVGYLDGTLIVVEVSPRTAVTLAGFMNDSHLTVTRW